MPSMLGSRASALRIVGPLLTALAATTGFVACGAVTDEHASGGSSSSGAGAGNGGAGSAAGGFAGAGSSNGGSGTLCSKDDCGPALGLPNTVCSDGSVAGPTGRCLQLDAGRCGWEVLSCPSGGDGGAGSATGGSNAGGAWTALGGEGGAVGGVGGAAGGTSGAGGTPAVDRCGGCDYAGPTPQICIYQSGGPGPGRFVCATQNPCGAAGACACIVNQGTCDVALQGGSPGYCVCHNGLD